MLLGLQTTAWRHTVSPGWAGGGRRARTNCTVIYVPRGKLPARRGAGAIRRPPNERIVRRPSAKNTTYAPNWLR